MHRWSKDRNVAWVHAVFGCDALSMNMFDLSGWNVLNALNEPCVTASAETVGIGYMTKSACQTNNNNKPLHLPRGLIETPACKITYCICQVVKLIIYLHVTIGILQFELNVFGFVLRNQTHLYTFSYTKNFFVDSAGADLLNKMGNESKAMGIDYVDNHFLCLTLWAECTFSSEDESTSVTVQVWLTGKKYKPHCCKLYIYI